MAKEHAANPSETARRITALTVPDLAKILAAAYRRQITVEQVQKVAEDGGLLRPDGTVSLLSFVAFLAREVTGGRDD